MIASLIDRSPNLLPALHPPSLVCIMKPKLPSGRDCLILFFLWDRSLTPDQLQTRLKRVGYNLSTFAKGRRPRWLPK